MTPDVGDTVLNVDRYDRMAFRELHEASPRLQDLGRRAAGVSPQPWPLVADLWAALFKEAPELLPPEKVGPLLAPNRLLLEKVRATPEYEALRAFTRLDELASALGTLHLGDELVKLAAGAVDPAAAREARKAAAAASNARERAEALAEAARFLEESGRPGAARKMAREAEQEKKRAAREAALARRLAAKVSRQLEGFLGTKKAREGLAAALAAAACAARDDMARLDALLGDLGWGTGPGAPQRVSPRDALALADRLAENPKLREVADLAGRAKVVAARKQKARTRETVERADVERGRDPALLLPSELLLARLARPEFLRRFAEGELLQYGRFGRERLGKGPLVVCIDTSGSMTHRDARAKAVMVALLAVAKKQRRAFAVVNFANAFQVRVWEFPRPRDLDPKTLVEMVEHFWNGGTDFQRPLSRAAEIIRSSPFDRADVVFITDGQARVTETWLEQFLELKKRRRFRVISVALDAAGEYELRRFSDVVVPASDLFDDRVLDAVLSV